MQISDPVFLASYLCRLAISNGKSRGLIRLFLLLLLVVLQEVCKHGRRHVRTSFGRVTNRVDVPKFNVFMPRLLSGLRDVFAGLTLMQITYEESGKVRGRKR